MHSVVDKCSDVVAFVRYRCDSSRDIVAGLDDADSGAISLRLYSVTKNIYGRGGIISTWIGDRCEPVAVQYGISGLGREREAVTQGRHGGSTRLQHRTL